MPADRDPDDGVGRPLAPGPVDEPSNAVGFLDMPDPDLDVDVLMDAISNAFSRLDDDAVLTAYCTAVGVAAMGDLCGRRGVELVHCVPHEAGTTFVLRRSGP